MSEVSRNRPMTKYRLNKNTRSTLLTVANKRNDSSVTANVFLYVQVFFRGASVNAIRGFPMCATMFLTYELSLQFFRSLQDKEKEW